MEKRSADASALKITGARENNLKNISLPIPHDAFVAVTGLSGSGKSSLAFDTVYAEGQRRYIETFSPYTRQFFDKVKRPAVDLIENVRPAIAIQQRTRITNSRSTVGSLTDINDYLKILWSNLANAVCPDCGINMESWSAESLSARLQEMADARRFEGFTVCAPVELPHQLEKSALEIERLKTLGFGRCLDPQSGKTLQLEELVTPPRYRNSTLLVALDRFASSSLDKKRLREAILQAFSLSEGRCFVAPARTAVDSRRPFRSVLNTAAQENLVPPALTILEYHVNFYCQSKELLIEKPKPALFSYNHPLGACPECRGFGKILSIDPALCVPDTRLSIKEKALHCWSGPSSSGEFKRLLRFCEKSGIAVDVPWRDLPEEHKQTIFEHRAKDFVGVRGWFKRKERKAYKMHVRVLLARYRNQFECPMCRGTRLKPQALAWRIAGLTLPAVWEMPVSTLQSWLLEVRQNLQAKQSLSRQLEDVFKLVLARLKYLIDLGLPYLTLNRQARTLSGGETQRVNLAGAIGSGLVSTHFVLDEPSVGLHMRDTERLIGAMRELQSRGNSLLVVEHDLDCIIASDHVLELGPKAGEEGGTITYNGATADWPHQSTAQICSAISAGDVDERIRSSRKTRDLLKIKNACARNLKGFDLDIPLQKFVCLSGVSGSGKSTLINEVIKHAYDQARAGITQKSKENLVHGFELVNQLLLVDQSPLSKTPRANIATYTGIWDVLRNMLSASDAATVRGLSKSAFSFNVDGGRCAECRGAGFIREDMQFLSDVYIPCEVCLGKRFQKSVLEVCVEGLNADDFLNMSVDRCAQVLAKNDFVASTATTLSALGLGHLRLGHPLSELSGGEAQRLKLVPFIQESAGGSALLIFDEPTTGLHWRDVSRLIDLLRLLVKRGHAVLCVEHNPLMLLASDWIIDLGPEGGEAGGYLIKQGVVKDFLVEAESSSSLTAAYLRRFVAEEGSAPRRAATAQKKSLVPSDSMRIEGAREHNLKDIDIEIPLNKIVAITGVSGSGKSTIAKDIVYAEGQRRYLDCLSPYARQFIRELKKPEIADIHNVRPALCVYQHTFQPSSLSTMGTMSEIYNFLRLLYAKAGTQYCPKHPQRAITPLAPAEMASEIRSLPHKMLRVLAPVIKQKKGNHRIVLQRAMQSEITELRVDGSFTRPSAFESGLEKNKVHSIDFVVAKFNPATLDLELIAEAVNQALALGGGTLTVLGDEREYTYSLERACSICKTGFFKPDPEDLSFNSRRGACNKCAGFGIDAKGGVCAGCGGARISATGRNLRLSVDHTPGKNIYEAALLNPAELETFLRHLELGARGVQLAEPILKELFARIDTLLEFGLEYLVLNRDCTTLSGGELQRLRLACAMGSPLSGVMYIFDEPSAGLHPLDNAKILSRFGHIRARGNSVLIIEHDQQTISAVEHVIDVGPGGGKDGGRIVYSGPLAGLLKDSDSVTAQALRGELGASPVEMPALSEPAHTISVRHASLNNIHNLSLSFPLGKLVTVCGVSGAGKSSLVHGVISEVLLNGKAKNQKSWSHGETVIESSTPIERVLQVDQKPIGKNSRSTPASYLGIFDEIRKLFASSIEAKSRGWGWNWFSYNTGKGRCPECKGNGEIKLEMSFIAEAAVMCESCRGSRYSDEAESVHYLGLTISQVLKLTFEEARSHFANHRKIHQALRQACELGLGYLTLGQPSGTLSGGESQRIKLVSELSSRRRGHTLYVLDEPTTGLHKADVFKLVSVLRQLAACGNSVLIIEHDADVLQTSDYLIELGPGAGDQGGRIIFQGTPDKLLLSDTPWGRILKQQCRQNENFSHTAGSHREKESARF